MNIATCKLEVYNLKAKIKYLSVLQPTIIDNLWMRKWHTFTVLMALSEFIYYRLKNLFIAKDHQVFTQSRKLKCVKIF